MPRIEIDFNGFPRICLEGKALRKAAAISEIFAMRSHFIFNVAVGAGFYFGSFVIGDTAGTQSTTFMLAYR